MFWCLSCDCSIVDSNSKEGVEGRAFTKKSTKFVKGTQNVRNIIEIRHIIEMYQNPKSQIQIGWSGLEGGKEQGTGEQ